MEKFSSFEKALKALCGPEASVLSRERIHGGDINNAWRMNIMAGTETTEIFVKTNSYENENFFAAEILGLNCLKSTGAIGVPEPLCYGIDNEAESTPFSFLILPYLKSARKNQSYWEDFGHELAALHRSDAKDFCAKNYGFIEDNFIGFSSQKNTPFDKWSEFYARCRLEPQFKRAWHYLDGDSRKIAESLIEKPEKFLPEPEFPSLLHGDLWSGNVYTGPDGKAWILDPACYAGHFEADLAMTTLFGRFPADFYNAYDEVNPVDKDFGSRINLYNLYHLVNHLNMFGPGYLGEVQEILKEYK